MKQHDRRPLAFFGDVKATGRDSVVFYTEQKVVIERWF